MEGTEAPSTRSRGAQPFLGQRRLERKNVGQLTPVFRFPGWRRVFEHGRDLFGEAACFCHGEQLLVDVQGVFSAACAHGANHNSSPILIDAIDQAVRSEAMLPVSGKLSAQRDSVAVRVNGQFFLQELFELLA